MLQYFIKLSWYVCINIFKSVLFNYFANEHSSDWLRYKWPLYDCLHYDWPCCNYSRSLSSHIIIFYMLQLTTLLFLICWKWSHSDLSGILQLYALIFLAGDSVVMKLQNRLTGYATYRLHCICNTLYILLARSQAGNLKFWNHGVPPKPI